MDNTDHSTPLNITIAVGADHTGVELKSELSKLLENDGYVVDNFGTDTGDSVDYPDYAKLVSDSVGAGRANFGILICGTGIGMSMAANHHPAIRAALCSTEQQAQLSREHNNANILCLGARQISAEQAKPIVRKFLSTGFAGGRHALRIAKIPL